MRHFNYFQYQIQILFIFNIFLTGSSCYTSSMNRCVGSEFRSRTIEKVDDHCARVARAVKNDHKDENTHDTQQWTIPIDAAGPRCKLSVHWLRSCICDSLNQDVTTISSYVGFFFRLFLLPCVYLYDGLHTVLLSYCRFECDSYSFYHDGSFGPINLGYAPCVWMCKFERALI